MADDVLEELRSFAGEYRKFHVGITATVEDFHEFWTTRSDEERKRSLSQIAEAYTALGDWLESANSKWAWTFRINDTEGIEMIREAATACSKFSPETDELWEAIHTAIDPIMAKSHHFFAHSVYNLLLPEKFVKGGVKLDHWGGRKVDQRRGSWGH